MLRGIQHAMMKVLCRRGPVVPERPSRGCRSDSLTNPPVRVNKTVRASASSGKFYPINLAMNRHRSSVEEENTLNDILEIALDTSLMERLADAGSRLCLCHR